MAQPNYPLDDKQFAQLRDRIRSYKEEIDISLYIRHTDPGFEKDRHHSTASNHVLDKKDPGTGKSLEVISCWRRRDDSNGKGHYMYANKLDHFDKGSIVEYIKSRHHTSSLLEVDKILSAYKNQLSLFDEVKSNREKIKPAQEIPRGIQVAKYFNLEPLRDRSYLHFRGIDDSIIDSPEFKGKIFNSTFKTKATGKEFVNTAFPIISASGEIIGMEQKNFSYSQGNGSWGASAAGTSKGRGVSVSNLRPNTKMDKLILAEAFLDCASHFALKEKPLIGKSNFYVSSNGAWSPEQLDIVQSLINAHNPKNVVLANDNDPQGYKYNIHLAGQICRPVDYLDKNELSNRPVPGSGIVSEDLEVKVTCHSAGNYRVKSTFEVNYETVELGREKIDGLLNRFKNLGVNDEGMPRFDAKITQIGKNSGIVEVYFQNSIQDLKVMRDIVIEVRKMENYIQIDKPRGKDWNIDLQDKLKKDRENAMSGDIKLEKMVKLSSGKELSEKKIRSFGLDIKPPGSELSM